MTRERGWASASETWGDLRTLVRLAEEEEDGGGVSNDADGDVEDGTSTVGKMERQLSRRERLVPVEFGGFGDARGRGVCSLRAFVERYLAPSNLSHRDVSDATCAASDTAAVDVAYVSQHALFHQARSVLNTFTFFHPRETVPFARFQFIIRP